jgi:ATP-binding cassette subfamily G (WHITE) protein 2 (SNQ2)
MIGEWSGEIYFNNGPRPTFFDRESAYILQDDLQIATLTVRETIYFAASFRMEEGSSAEEINKRVELLLELMSLSHIQDSFVGDAMHRGISGGQLKRLSIAVEMVSLPFIVFLDEPTSGLDSTMALDVMQTACRLAREHRTCIATIHQPSPEVFALFDYVVLLSEGRLIYFGTVHQVQEYFCGQVLSYTWEEGKNPAEFLIEVSEGLLIPDDRSMPLTAVELDRMFSNSPYKYLPELSNAKERISVSEVDNGKMYNQHQKGSSAAAYARLHATTKWTQFKLLMYRCGLSIIRDRDETLAHLLKNFAVGLLYGIIFYGEADVSTPLFDENGLPTSDVLNVASLLYSSLMFVMMSNIQAIPHLISRNLIFRREVASFAYAVSPYWLAHTLSIIPMMVVGYFLFLMSCYFTAGFPLTGAYFFYYYFLILFAGLISYYYAMLLAALIPQENLAFEAFALVFTTLNIFVGFLITLDNIPAMWSWVPYINFSRWAFQGLMVNQWEDYDDDSSGQTVLELYGFDGFDKMDAFWILFLYILALVVLVYAAMRPPLKKLVKVARVPSATISPIIEVDDDKKLNLKSTLLQPADAEAQHFFFQQHTPRFQDGQSVSNVSILNTNSNNSIVDATKVPKKSGYHLTFCQLSYTVDGGTMTASKNGLQEPLKILQNVTGRVEPREMCAVMGASGAGKSTLLDILADRKTIGRIEGEIFINGHARTADAMESTAYVMQDSAHKEYLTVRETLEFAANFRMLQSEPAVVKEQRVKDLLMTLRLDTVADSMVGDMEARGISGGQRRRLSIGVEMVHLPKMLFLDEPTTGLDSASANEVVSVLRILTNQHRTVICTIHQPSAKCFSMFDKVLLLGEGRTIYFGAMKEMQSYFMNCVYQFPYKEGRNVADYMADIGSGTSMNGVGDHGVVTVSQLVEMYEGSDLYLKLESDLVKLLKEDEANYPPPPPTAVVELSWWERMGEIWIEYVPGAKVKYSTSQWYQVKQLWYRKYLERIRCLPVLLAPVVR